MNDGALETTGPDAATPDPFGGVPEASRPRRHAAAVLDVIAGIGAPWVIALFCVPLVLPFIEFIPVAIALLVLSCAAALTTWVCGRLPNGERLSAGRMVTGLTVLRTTDAHRVVLARDVEGPLRPKRGRVIGARVGFALTAVVAMTTLSLGSYLAYAVIFQSQNQAAADAEWAAQEPEARRACVAFTAELLKGGAGAGERYVVEQAAKALPDYRRHLKDTRVTSFQDSGWGQTTGEWEYMFVEVGDTPADAVDTAQVSILIQKRDGRFVVTQLSWHTPPGTEAQ